MCQCACVGVLAALFAVLPVQGEEGDYTPAPEYPAAAREAGEQGRVVVKGWFGADGSVTDCRVIESDTTPEIGKSTVAWIKEKWHSKSQAGKDFQVPIIYIKPKASVFEPIPPPAWQNNWYRYLSRSQSEWMRDFVPPAFMCYSGEILSLSVSFDSAGRAAACSVTRHTGSPSYDSFAAGWVKRYWHHADFAGKTAQMTMAFDVDPREDYGFYVKVTGLKPTSP